MTLVNVSAGTTKLDTAQKVELPKVYRGEHVIVNDLGIRDRAKLGLSTPNTIVEVIGDQRKLEEAVAYARRKKVVGLDLECGGELDEDGLNPWRGDIILCQIGDEERQYIIWYQTIDPTPIHELLSDPDVVKVGVNLKFDLRFFLVKHGFTCRGANIVDAQIIEQLLGCGMFSEDDDNVGAALTLTGMGMMAKRWLGLNLPKDEELRTGWAKMTPGVWAEDFGGITKKFYAADDVIIPLRLIKKQKPWIRRLGLAETVNLEHAFLPVLAEMEVRGIKVDMEKWDALSEEANQLATQARKDLDRIFDVTVTVEIDPEGNATLTRDKKYTSTPQLKNLIRDYMRKEHNTQVILCNKQLREALEEAQVPKERIEKLFQDATEHIEKLKAQRPGKKKATGAPSSGDLLATLWPKVKRHLAKNAFYALNTESSTFKLYRVIGKTPEHKVDGELPTAVGFPADLVDPILALRKHTKAAGTYGDNWHKLINTFTHRLHCSFIQAALTTGRISSTPNFQNLPADKRYRSCFIPADGFKYVGADWDQIEPRIIASLSEDPAYMRVFWSKFPGTPGFVRYCRGVKEALDLYTEIGKMIGVIPEWMTLLDTKGNDEHPPLEDGVKGRKQAKIVVLGLGYGTGVPKFWIGLIVDTKEHHTKEYAATLHKRFWEIVPKVKDTLDKFSALTDPKNTKSPQRIWHPFTDCEVTFSRTIGGRKRFYKPDSYKWWTTGRNHPIQGTGADIMKKTAVLLARWMWANEIEGGIVNLIHDEILAEVREDQAEIVQTKMAEFMSVVGKEYCPNVPITAAGYIDTIWKKD